MRIGILTSVDTRHRHFVRAIQRHANVVAVVYEQTGYSPARAEPLGLTTREKEIVAGHYRERTRQEELFFGHDSEFVEPGEGCCVMHLERGTLNSSETVRFLASAGPEAVLVYGTNLVKPPLLGHFSCPFINLHLGLSPYYRGTATNFYPLLNEEPQFVGATIHLIDSGIDSGAIFRHARPVIVADDQPHTIGCKALAAGIEAMLSVLRDVENDKARALPQWKPNHSRLYLRKDFHPRHVVELYKKLEDGLIPRYVAQADELSSRVRLILGDAPGPSCDSHDEAQRTASAR